MKTMLIIPNVVMVFAILFFFSCFVHRRLSKTTIHQSIHSAKQLLSPRRLTEHELLAERSRPNERLIRAFGLSNTFVSSDTEVHKNFVRQARSMIYRANGRGWKDFRDIAFRATGSSLREEEQNARYDTAIQSITLRTILVGLLGVELGMEDLKSSDITTVANHITNLWSLSKKSDSIPQHLLAELNTHLRRLVPEDTALQNPLNFVIPAWETMWRVVAAALAHIHDNPGMRSVFSEFYAAPNDEMFRKWDSSSGLSVKAVIEETLRLYPPSRHIVRVRQNSISRILPSCVLRIMQHLYPKSVQSRSYADIEYINRATELWGDDAETFDPRRHHFSRIQPQQQEAVSLSFGYGPLRCAAFSWAPMAAAVVCAAILEFLDETRSEILSGPRIGGRAGWDEWSIRKQKTRDLT